MNGHPAFDATLACGHADDDPFAFHHNAAGELVCSRCCTEHADQHVDVRPLVALELDRRVPDVSGRDVGGSDVKPDVTSLRINRQVAADESLEAIRRLLRALSRRVAESDTEALRSMVELRDEIEQDITDAIAGLRNDPDVPASWNEIGMALGITRQAAQQRYGHVGGRRRPGGQPGHLR